MRCSDDATASQPCPASNGESRPCPASANAAASRPKCTPRGQTLTAVPLCSPADSRSANPAKVSAQALRLSRVARRRLLPRKSPIFAMPDATRQLPAARPGEVGPCQGCPAARRPAALKQGPLCGVGGKKERIPSCVAHPRAMEAATHLRRRQRAPFPGSGKNKDLRESACSEHRPPPAFPLCHRHILRRSRGPRLPAPTPIRAMRPLHAVRAAAAAPWRRQRWRGDDAPSV